MVKIGSVEITGRFTLAPMAGVSDFAFRAVCREQGAALTTTATGRFTAAANGNVVHAFTEEAYNNTSGADQLVRVRAAKGGIRVA